MAYESGAKKVFIASAAPPVRHPNVYGINMPTRSELVAYNRTEAQVAEFVGAEAIIYLELPDLIDACREFNPKVLTGFDCSVFDGVYVTGGVGEEYLSELEKTRAHHMEQQQSFQLDIAEVEAKHAKENDGRPPVSTIGLHNHNEVPS